MSRTTIATIDQRPPSTDLDAFLAMSTEELRAELSRSLELTATHLTRLAFIVRALEDRGEDLSDLRIGLLSHLRRIAYGQVLPELVVRFATSPSLLRYAGTLPLPDQRKLADGSPVPFVSRTETGEYATRLVDPLNLSATEVRQVLGPEGLRGEAEQIVAIQRSGKPLSPTAPPRKVGKVRADRRRVGLIVGTTFVPASVVVEALAQVHDPDAATPGELTETITVKLTEAERLALHSAAGRADLSMAAMVRRALIGAGLLSTPEGH